VGPRPDARLHCRSHRLGHEGLQRLKRHSATSLALQVAALDANPKADVASCYSAVIGADGAQLGWRFGGNANGDVYWEMLEWDMVSGGSVPLCRRAAFDRVGFFDESLTMRSDWDMWIRLARHGQYVTAPRVLVGYMRSPSSASRQYERVAAAGQIVLAKAAREDARFSPRYQRFCRARDTFAVACMCAIDDQVALARRYLARSIATNPIPVRRAPRRLVMFDREDSLSLHASFSNCGVILGGNLELEQRGNNFSSPPINVVLGHNLSHFLHPSFPFLRRHAQGDANRFCQLVFTERIDDDRVRQFARGPRKLTEYQDAVFVPAAGHVFFRHQIHAIVQRTYDAETR
jgi:hypothetical protein